MDTEITDLRETAAELRNAHRRLLAPRSRQEIIEALSAWSVAWQRSESPWREQAARLTEPFPFVMVQISLEALLSSLTPDLLESLCDQEKIGDRRGPALIGHVIAGNTPLLAWVSLLRALLVGSASLVKLPSGPAAEWGRLFQNTLREIDPDLASCIALGQWPGGTELLEREFCRAVDQIVAYGSDQTILEIQRLAGPKRPVLGYGHRVSFALVLKGADLDLAAQGLATDILMYDQGGCLSPHCVFVEGEFADAQGFGALLADALAMRVGDFPMPRRSVTDALTVREARAMAAMESGLSIWQDDAMRWTVLCRPTAVFTHSPTHGVVSVQPLSRIEFLRSAIDGVFGYLQGSALAAPGHQWDQAARLVTELGVSYLCLPGRMQAPPFSWREDGRTVLSSLLRETS